jgi:hypothetical protein
LRPNQLLLIRALAVSIMLLPVDIAAGAVLTLFDAGAFLRRKAGAVGAAARFVAGDACLLACEACGFVGSQAAGPNTLADPVGLVMLPLINAGVCGDGGCRGTNGGERKQNFGKHHY